MLHFDNPWALWLLLLIPLFLWIRYRHTRQATLPFSSLKIARLCKTSWRLYVLKACPLLEAAVIALLLIAISRPQKGQEKIDEYSRGIAIEMVLDRSGSMVLGMEENGSVISRFEAAKRTFVEFIHGDQKELKGRRGDLVGLVVFARYPDTICPLTLVHGIFPYFLKEIQPASTKIENGTAIGDAIFLGAARLKNAEDTLKQQKLAIKSNYELKSKVMILLTDGENNYGRETIRQAGELLQKWKIKLYVISISSENTYQPVETPFGRRYRRIRLEQADTKELEHAAQQTGGMFRSISDPGTLREVYREIDQLERSEVKTTRWVDYRELCFPFLFVALLLLLLDILLENTNCRTIP